MGAYVVRTSSLNDKHSCQLFRMGLRDKTTPTSTTPLIRANMSCAVAIIFSSLTFLFFIRLHGQPEPFGSCIILQSCSSFVFCPHGQPELFASDHLLQSWVSLQLIVVISLQSFESGQALFLVFSYFASYPQPFFPLSSVSDDHVLVLTGVLYSYMDHVLVLTGVLYSYMNHVLVLTGVLYS